MKTIKRRDESKSVIQLTLLILLISICSCCSKTFINSKFPWPTAICKAVFPFYLLDQKGNSLMMVMDLRWNENTYCIIVRSIHIDSLKEQFMNSLHVFIFARLEKRLCITNHSDHVSCACGECLSPAQVPSHNLLRRFHSHLDWPFYRYNTLISKIQDYDQQQAQNFLENGMESRMMMMSKRTKRREETTLGTPGRPDFFCSSHAQRAVPQPGRSRQ